MAAATITIAHQRQISVPADLTVCGFDDTPLAAAIWPTLTTIRQPIRDMSRAAMTLLAEAMKRSEEHTSEPQSLMRHSYAGFCLKTTITSTPHVRQPSHNK